MTVDGSPQYQGRAYLRPRQQGVVLLDADGQPTIEAWFEALLAGHGYVPYSEAQVTITVGVEPSQRSPDDDARTATLAAQKDPDGRP
jgi:hypothetical protein